MPAPVVEPIPPSRAVRLAPPDDAQEASYLAASARISSFCSKVLGILHYYCSLFVLFAAGRIPAMDSGPCRPSLRGVSGVFARGLVCYVAGPLTRAAPMTARIMTARP